MAVTAINPARVSFNMRAMNLLESMRANQEALYRQQNYLATGLRFVQPSEDPIRASAATTLQRRLESLSQVGTNVQNAEAKLSELDTSMQDALTLVSDAQVLANEAVGDTITEDERHALSTVVDSILDQLVTVANRRHLNTYLFSGHQDAAPFVVAHGGVMYTGDANRMVTVIDTDMSEDAFTVPGMEFFAAVTAGVQGAVDLDPALTEDTRISDLDGALGRGVELGRIVVTVDSEQTDIDLSGAATVGDVIDKLNAELSGEVTASLGTRGITLTVAGGRSGDVAVSDASGGRTAVDLGLSGSFSGATRAGADLNPRVTGLTQITALKAGAGVDLSSGITIRNGGSVATIDLADADTVEDVVNRINEADVGAWARIAEDGERLEILNRVSGTDMTIEENGGLAATALGVRSLHEGTTLASLNDGLGVETADGDDLRITTQDGTTVEVDLDGTEMIQDVLDRLNAAGGGAITADLLTKGNGLVITDNTLGSGVLRIEALNTSLALEGLGLDVTPTGSYLVGGDVNPQRVDSPFTALFELQEGMEKDERLTMVTASQRIERVMKEMQGVQGEMASSSQAMSQRYEQVESEIAATQVLLSDVQDADITDAAIRFQQLQTALQANLGTATQVLNLSLLDYLG